MKVPGERGDGQAGDDVVGLADTSVAEDPGQVANVALDDVEVLPVAESVAEQAAEVGVSLQHDHPAAGRRPLGEDPRDRPGSRAQLDDHPGPLQSMFRTVVRDSQGLLGARLAIAVPCLRNLPRNSVKSLMVSIQ